jgi:inner membrane protein
MTGPTHVATAVSVAMMCGASGLQVAFIAAGALVPDLDHPMSIIGRIFLPVSIPLNRWLGHRGAFHAFWLWLGLAALGVFYQPLFWIGIGAVLHVIADCYTVSGVRGMTPFSSKLFIFFKRDWRIKTGSRGEIVILLIAGAISWTAHSVGTMGGLSSTIAYLTQAPKIMVEEYTKQGLKVCEVKGKFRYLSGEIIEGQWLIIGIRGSGIAFLVNDKILDTTTHGKFLKARLVKTDRKWNAVRVQGFNRTERTAYYLQSKKWLRAPPGGLVCGSVIGENLSLSSAGLPDEDFQKKLDLIE